LIIIVIRAPVYDLKELEKDDMDDEVAKIVRLIKNFIHFLRLLLNLRQPLRVRIATEDKSK